MGTIRTSYLGRNKLNIFLGGPLFTEHSLIMRKVGWTLLILVSHAHIVNKMAALQREREKSIRFKKINF